MIAVEADGPVAKVDWVRAFRALGEIFKDSSRSDKVAELAVSLEGDGLEKCYRRFRAHPDGRKLLAQKPSLLRFLVDNRARFKKLPSNTFGRAYADYMDEERLDGEVLAEVTDVFNPAEARYDADRKYFRDRIRDSHDVWHALTGYGADELGEAALLAFTQAQIPNLGVAVLAGTAFAFAPLGIPNDRLGWQPYMVRAYLRGRRARWLPAVKFEELFDKPLPDVQRLLGIAPSHAVHPKGIYAYSRGQKCVRRLKSRYA